MKYSVCIIIILLILGLYFYYSNEGFTVYRIDFGPGFNRCMCSGDGGCKCINDYENNYPLYY
jgi:hypothetical protein